MTTPTELSGRRDRLRARAPSPADQVESLAAEIRQVAMGRRVDRGDLLALAHWCDVIAARIRGMLG